MEASFKILISIRGFYTHESLSTVQPYQGYHFQADLIWCDGTFSVSVRYPFNY